MGLSGLTIGTSNTGFCLTSKMSHAGSWRAACNPTICFPWFHLENPSVAHGVTDPGVDSGALLGGMGMRRSVVACRQCSGKPQHAGSELSEPRVRIPQGERRQGAPYPRRFAGTNTPLTLTEITMDSSCRIGAERPNVKDEPRRELARRVQHDDLKSAVSFRKFVT